MLVLFSLVISSVAAWSPGRLLQLGRRHQRLVKRPVPTTLQVLAERPQASSSKAEDNPSNTASNGLRHVRHQGDEDAVSEAPLHMDESSLEHHMEMPSLEVLDDQEHGKNRKVPQIHLPPRLAPGVGWKHHHQATTNFVHSRLQRRRNSNEKLSLTEPMSEGTVEERRKLLVSNTPEWRKLEQHKKDMEDIHLRELLQDADRSEAMFAEHDGVYLDYSRQRAGLKTLELLQDLATRQRVPEKIKAMVSGEKINFTEKRAVLHTALRSDRDEEVYVDGENVVEEVHQVLDQIKHFTEGVRSGELLGYTGKRLRNIISVGIGGSYLGPEFLHEVLKTEPEGINAALGYSLRFLANVDPVDVERTCADLDPEETLIVIVSKTFTTAETMLNARTMRQWLWDFMGNDKDVVRKHMVACASVSATDNVKEFGIDTDRYFFRFWDWVGGRYSVCSAAGAVPISLLYGFDLFEKFLKVSQDTRHCMHDRHISLNV